VIHDRDHEIQAVRDRPEHLAPRKYVIAVGALAVVFAGIVSLSSVAVSTDNGLAVAATTLIAAALVNPSESACSVK
jgi:hypothetical protein